MSGVPGIAATEVAVNAQGIALIDIAFVSGDQPVTALQFDIRYPNQTVTLGRLVSPGDAVAGSAKNILTADPQPLPSQPSVRRILIVGMNQTPIPSGIVARLSVQVKPDTLSGLYPLELRNAVGSGSSGKALFLQVLDGGVTVPGPDVRAVANAASYAATAVAPGEIIVVGGRTLAPDTTATLHGAKVLFDGIPAPLVYTTPNLISAVVPYAVDGQTQTSLQVEYQGIRSAPFLLAVAGSSPGIFTLNASGSGPGAIVNDDFTINGPGNPAPRGSIVSIYGTGEGQTMPPGIDGSIVDPSALRRPVLPVTVTIAEQDAKVEYAGSAGSQISGFLQVNVRVPLSIAPSDAAPVTLTIGGRSSQKGVTMAIQ